MGKSKLIIICIVLLSLVGSLICVSAENNEYTKIEGNELTFHDVRFNIPDGYELMESSEDFDKNNQIQSDENQKSDTCALKDNDGHRITINVLYDGNFTESDLIYLENAEIHTINDVEGYLSHAYGTYMFSYLYKGNVVLLSGNETTLSQMVVKE